MGITHHLSFAALAPRRRGGLIANAAAIFALGFAAGATIRPAPTPHGGASITTALAAAHDASERTPTAATHSRTFDRQLAYPADVIRIIDGDTFEARVRVWSGLNVDTKVRLRNVDAPELHARCADELAKAQAARRGAGNDAGGGRGDDFAGGDRQIWRPGRCRGLDARHRRRIRRAP